MTGSFSTGYFPNVFFNSQVDKFLEGEKEASLSGLVLLILRCKIEPGMQTLT